MVSDKFMKALAVVQTAAVGASATAGGLAQAPGADEVALTAITTAMAWGIAKLYNMKATGEGVAMFVAVAFGATFGVKLATKFISWFPLVGNVASAASTFVLHQLTGFALIGYCELCCSKGEQPDISNFDASHWYDYVAWVKEHKTD